MTSLRWRLDIQGLRAIAVLAVVFYHARFSQWSGGYAGVDVFFVISGYLITGLLVRELAATGKIDFVSFYYRRLRRLAPALAATIAGTIVACFFVYSPVVQVRLAESAAYTSVYLSNILFSVQATDYLAADANGNPFLHTWSLAVEEQFYLVWPLLMLVLSSALSRHHRKIALALAAVGLVSLACCFAFTWTGRNYYSFFLFPFRAWEFIAGGVVFVAGESAASRYRLAAPVASLISVLGLGLIACAMFLLSSTTPYPGLATLLPVVGTALVIWGGQNRAQQSQPLVNRLLCLRPLVRIGGVSYSWYLWHWPVLVLGFELRPWAGTPMICLWLLVSYGLAELSCRFIEQGYRVGSQHGTRVGNLARAGSIAGLAAALSVGWLLGSQYLTQRPFLDAYRLAADDIPAIYTRKGEHGNICNVEATSTSLANCVDGMRRDGARVVLLGDSHAAQWAPAVADIAEKHNWRLFYFTKAGCSALPLPTPFNDQLNRPYVECTRWTQNAFERIRRIQPDIVLFSGSITAKYTADQWREGVVKLPAALGLDATHARLLLIGDVARPQFDVPACLSGYAWHRRLLGWLGWPIAQCAIADTHGFRQQVLASWQAAAETMPRTAYVDTDSLVCESPSVCSPIDDVTATVKYRDGHHLTATFVEQLGPLLQQRLEAALGVSTPTASLR